MGSLLILLTTRMPLNGISEWHGWNVQNGTVQVAAIQ